MAKEVRAGKIVVELGLIGKFERQLKLYQAKMQAFGDAAENIGKKLSAAGAFIFAPFAAGAKVFADFEQQMAMVSTMVDDPKLMEGFSKGIKNMSVEFGESTATLAKGLYDILSASVPASQALNVLAVSAKAAKAGLTDTGVAADAITTILNSYGLSASKAAAVSDWMFTIVKRGKTTFGELAPQIGVVATTAATAGVGLDELGASLAVMTRNGLRTERAITAVQAIIASFLAPSKEAADYAKTLGIEMSTTTLKSKGLADVFQLIAKLPPDAISKLFPSQEALRGVLPAIKDMQGFGEDIAAMRQSAGATEIAYQKMAATISNSFARLKQAGLLILSILGDSISKPLKTVSDAVLRVAKASAEWLEKNKRIVLLAAAAGAALLALGGVFLGLAVTAKVLAGALSLVSSVMTITKAAMSVISFVAPLIMTIGGSIASFLISPLGIVTVAVVALGAAFLYFSGLGGKVLSWLGEKFNALKDIALTAWRAISDALLAGNFALAGKILWTSLQLAWQTGIASLKQYWFDFLVWYQTFTSDMFFNLTAGIAGAWAGLKIAWVETVSFLSKIWTTFILGIQAAWNATQAALEKGWLSFMGLFDKSIDVEAAYKLVDNDLASKNNEAADNAQKSLDESNAKAAGSRSQIEKERDDYLGLLAQQQEADRAGIIADHQDSMKASLEALNQAKKEYNDAIAKAAKSGSKKKDKSAEFDAKTKGAAGAIDSVRGKVETRGSFYALDRGLLAGSTGNDRQLKAAEDTAKNTKETRDLLKNAGSLMFT